MVSEQPTTHGPHEAALRSAGLLPAFRAVDGQAEVTARVAGETFYGYGSTREGAMLDLIQDLPEPTELRVRAALIA